MSVLMNYEKGRLVLIKAEIAVKDACILIDLVELGLIQSFYRLNIVAYTTPQVMAEITQEEQLKVITEHIDNANLKIDGDGLFETISQIAQQNRGLSFADCSVLEVGLRRNCMILSSDGSLRKMAISSNLTVRGLIWVIEELYINGIIGKESAIKKLEEYLIVNERAPNKEVEGLINKLKQL